MTAEHPPKDEVNVKDEDPSAYAHLEIALEETEDAEAMFRIRQAMQHLEARESVRCCK